MGLGRGIGRGVVLATALAALALPAGASAATSCARSGTNVGITLTADADQASLSVNPGDVTREIQIQGAGATPVTCSGGDPTLDNVDTINITQIGAIRGSVGLLIPEGGFGPGATPETGSTSEIEVVVDLGAEAGLNDTFDVGGFAGDNDVNHMRFGSLAGGGTGANLNLPESGTPDGDDMRLIDVEQFQASGGTSTLEFGAKTLDASGGPEFTGRSPSRRPRFAAPTAPTRSSAPTRSTS